ncbi:unnamed protein product [Ceratitis capitata]|uniref:(Mediterranean fruit fly) hypothetical protein n=1 Tax=Ceratitis capitata TaxID=7213 RepID=A0A811UTC8_CERCA|nr:unnamed protein product [Ceratitis capitata]
MSSSIPWKTPYEKLYEEAVQPVESDIILDDEDDDIFSGIAGIDTRLALNGPDSDEWKLATESEIMSLIKNDTFDIIKADNHKNIVVADLYSLINMILKISYLFPYYRTNH